MGRKAGVPNKVTTQVKQKLEELIDGIVNSIDNEELTKTKKLRCFKYHCSIIYQECKHQL